MTPPVHSSPRAAGFTLIELLVVVVIMGIMASLAGVASGGHAEQDLDLGEVQVRDAIVRARALAVSNRMGMGVVFDPAAERFAVLTQDGTPAVDPLTKGDYVVDFNRPGQPAGLTIQSADFGAAGAAALFDAQGVPLLGGSVVLASGGLTRTLTVDAATGLVSGS